MDAQVANSKSALRSQVRAQLKGMTDAKRKAGSAAARALLGRQRLWQEARSVLLFAPLPEELDVWPLLAEALAAGKTVSLPRFSAENGRYVACEVKDAALDLEVGRFGIREPVRRCREISIKLDLILVPGLALDLHGRRLGRGKGFYDQLLAAVRGTTCGVAFDEQIVRTVPVEPHDVPLNCILTPTRWIEL